MFTFKIEDKTKEEKKRLKFLENKNNDYSNVSLNNDQKSA